jgi:predicted RNA-binding Zn-ribbon protein involved in translation (DUF1610 family)
VCGGTTRRPVPAEEQRHKTVCAGYDAATDTFTCRNCGGQYIFGKATGKVNLNQAGVPCTHAYEGVNAGRSYTKYTCKHCGDKYDVDSSD